MPADAPCPTTATTASAAAPDALPPPELQRRLLAIAAGHVPLSILALLVLPPLLWWLHRQYGTAPLMNAWVGLMWALAGVMAAMLRRLRAELPRPGPHWPRRLAWLALCVGLGWTLPVPITLHAPMPQFHLTLYAALCAVVSSGATYMGLLPVAFRAFALTVLAVAMLGAPWIFPGDWPFIAGALLLFGAITLRHARQNRRFMARQLALEEGYRRMSEQATRALQEKNHFLNAASHDLRQPVHALGLAVEAALHQHGADERLRPLLAHLRQCTRAIQFMLASLLDLSRIEAGPYEARPQILDVRALLDEVPSLFGAQAHQQGLDLRVRATRQALHLRADPALLRQALFNLVQNAIRYTPRGGVRVTARVRQGQALLQVWDTGVGMAEAEQARLFQPFQRGAGHAPAAHGPPASAAYGLGLAVVARCAALLGARHGVRSVPGRGSCFWLSLPLAGAPAAPDEAACVPAASAPAADVPLHQLHGRCLVVEDDPAARHAWQALLDAWGVQARFADSHATAHQHLDAGFAPHALVCDVRLRSGDNGWHLLQSLARRCPDAGCLLVSGDLDAPEFAEAGDHGCLVLHKPVAPAALHLALRAWMR
ncbi:hybrid sensor histidine kinase/response regulator [Comamonadaceae bacterium OH2545_COT-014]|nr:hybrid sensor histidine kinase/response regulator [Comamonadaceae bacterium OH2545_COT-014]